MHSLKTAAKSCIKACTNVSKVELINEIKSIGQLSEFKEYKGNQLLLQI
jgi:hypothetical protein